MHIKSMRHPQEKKANRQLNVSTLECHSVHQNLSEDLNSKLGHLIGTKSTEEDWAAFRDVVDNIAIAHLDQNTHKHQDWFEDNDEDIQKLLDEKCEAFRSHQQDTTSASKKAAYNSIKSKVQAKLREMQDFWLSRKADQIQKYADSNNSKHFYDALKTIYGLQSSGTSPLLSADGSTLLTDKNAILKRALQHCPEQDCLYQCQSH
ncbi:hypothetical protein NDU88_002269 [Pleurodeles waltl]|uniref:Uncharacterized protein n=1 Tax=Pleurodeles waltl TaxID=8319 RepID=A0AAV7MQ13_PLEWA|nr:hypothetical protein NDU88_002269 [Pleurodeles waltl]